jgi:hypothetical protein
MLNGFDLLYIFRILTELKSNQNCERREDEEDKFYIDWVYSDVNKQSFCLR